MGNSNTCISMQRKKEKEKGEKMRWIKIVLVLHSTALCIHIKNKTGK